MADKIKFVSVGWLGSTKGTSAFQTDLRRQAVRAIEQIIPKAYRDIAHQAHLKTEYKLKDMNYNEYLIGDLKAKLGKNFIQNGRLEACYEKQNCWNQVEDLIKDRQAYGALCVIWSETSEDASGKNEIFFIDCGFKTQR